MNCPFRRTERAIPLQVCSPLISQDIRLSELAPFQLSSNDDYSLAGCRGIAGPFPPPLWIRAPCGAIGLCRHNIIGQGESQFSGLDTSGKLCKNGNAFAITPNNQECYTDHVTQGVIITVLTSLILFIRVRYGREAEVRAQGL